MEVRDMEVGPVITNKVQDTTEEAEEVFDEDITIITIMTEALEDLDLAELDSAALGKKMWKYLCRTLVKLVLSLHRFFR